MTPPDPADRADWSEAHPAPHPVDHRWPRAVRMLFVLGCFAASALLVIVGLSALLDAIWDGARAS